MGGGEGRSSLTGREPDTGSHRLEARGAERAMLARAVAEDDPEKRTIPWAWILIGLGLFALAWYVGVQESPRTLRLGIGLVSLGAAWIWVTRLIGESGGTDELDD